MPNTYDNEEIAKVVVAKAAPYFAHHPPADIAAIDLPDTFACLSISEAARVTESPIRVLDFGGAAGLHYLHVKRAIDDVPLRWAVVETPSMVREAAVLQRDDLRFFQSVAEASEWLGGVDVALSIGSLNYTPDPEHAMREIMECTPSTWVIGRQAMTFGPKITLQYVTPLSQNGPGPLPEQFTDKLVRYKATFMNHDDFMNTTAMKYGVLLQHRGREVGKKDEQTFIEFNFLFKRMPD